MSRILNLVAGFFLFGCVAVVSAQTSNAQATQGTRPDSGAQTMQGCLQQSGDEFMLAGHRRSIELIGNQDFHSHVGQVVKVTGSWDRTADRNEAAGKGHAGENVSSSEAREHHDMKERHFQVNSLEKVSETCTPSTPKSK